MIVIDIPMPKTCAECPLSYWVRTRDHDLYKALCQVDMDTHKPMSDGCPIVDMSNKDKLDLDQMDQGTKAMLLTIALGIVDLSNKVDSLKEEMKKE